MKFGRLKEVTGKFVKESYKWLMKEQMGCYSICFASDSVNDYVVCIGWTGCYSDTFDIAWKIGRQSRYNIMQCDFDIDFEMPYNEETGDVDDTYELIEVEGGKPLGYESWAALAKRMREQAQRVWDDWKEEEAEE